MGKTNFDDLELGDRAIEAREIGSENASDGQVLTADGAGGAAWEDVAGAVRMVGTALIGGDFGGDARGAKAVDLQTGHADPAFVASGAGAVAIGYNVRSSGYAATAVGANRFAAEYFTLASGEYSVAIGAGSKAYGQYSVAIGRGLTTGLGGVAIGKAGAYVGQSIAIGSEAYARQYGAIAIGFSANVTHEEGLAIGADARALAAQAVAIGIGARATAANGVAFGSNVQNPTANSVKIGWNNTNGFAHFTTFTPTAGTPSTTHFLPVNLGGTVYKFLLAT